MFHSVEDVDQQLALVIGTLLSVAEQNQLVLNTFNKKYYDIGLYAPLALTPTEQEALQYAQEIVAKARELNKTNALIRQLLRSYSAYSSVRDFGQLVVVRDWSNPANRMELQKRFMYQYPTREAIEQLYNLLFSTRYGLFHIYLNVNQSPQQLTSEIIRMIMSDHQQMDLLADAINWDTPLPR